MRTKKKLCGCKSKKSQVRKGLEKAFTLLEMLVVIAIIGILATLIIFSISGTRQKASAVKAKGDMSQLQKAVEKASGVDGCLSMTITTAGNAAVVRCVTNSTDYASVQPPAFGNYVLNINGCTITNNSPSTWASTSGCGTGVTPSTYVFTTTGLSGAASYTCTPSGCTCSSGNCDTF